MNPACPTTERVEAYAFGTLQPEQADTLSEHLDTCISCKSAYESIVSQTDPVVAGLRAGGDNVDMSQVRQLAAKLREIGQDNPPEPEVETSAVAEQTVEFDPLHVWLGIPPEEQPADHYRLLGLRQYEHNAEVIESAADRQMAHLRSFQSGKRGQFAQEVLNQVSAARVCLLNPQKKRAYDEQLQEQGGKAQQEAPGKIDLPTDPPRTIDEFRHIAVSLGLLSDAKLDKYLAQLPPHVRPNDAQSLARVLVDDGRLTKHQAASIYQGKWQKLVLGEYTLLSSIGGGGMGDVYKALHRRMGVVRAIKVMKPELVNSLDAIGRFHREVMAAAQLSHQHIVLAHDAGEDQGRHYLVMEYIDGPDLGSLVKKKGQMSPERAIDFLIQAARGLGFAHSKGTIHRDVKPGNLLLGTDGVVKVSDLGLARLDPDKSDVDEAAHLTTSEGKILGTVDFMAPEQADNTHTADERADIYSLGCTLYRLLTCDSPYGKGSAIQRMMAHRNAPIPKIRDRRPEISEQLDEVFARMVAKRPEDRPQTMQEVEQLLKACLHGGEVPLPAPASAGPVAGDVSASLRPLPRAQQLPMSASTAQPRINTHAAAKKHFDLQKLIRSPAGITAAGIGLALMFFVAAALAIMLTIRTSDGEFVVQIDGEIAPDVKIQLKQGGEVIEIASATNGWKISLEEGEYQLEVQGGNDQFQLDKYVASVTRDGKEIVRLSRKRDQRFEDSTEPSSQGNGFGRARVFIGHTGSVQDVAFSPCGRWLASASGYFKGDETLRIWDVDTGKEVRQLEGHNGQVTCVSFLPDGRLLSAGRDWKVRSWNVETGEALHRFDGLQRGVSSLAVSRDGQIVAAGDDQGTVLVWEVRTGNVLQKYDEHEDAIIALAISPDGKRVISGGFDRHLVTWNVADGQEVGHFDDGRPAAVTAVTFTPDGKQIVTSAKDRNLRRWDVATQKELGNEQLDEDVQDVALTPDGRHAVGVLKNGEVVVWNLTTDATDVLAHVEGLHFWTVAVSPDGQFVAGAGGDKGPAVLRPRPRLPHPPVAIAGETSVDRHHVCR